MVFLSKRKKSRWNNWLSIKNKKEIWFVNIMWMGGCVRVCHDGFVRSKKGIALKRKTLWRTTNSMQIKKTIEEYSKPANQHVETGLVSRRGGWIILLGHPRWRKKRIGTEYQNEMKRLHKCDRWRPIENTFKPLENCRIDYRVKSIKTCMARYGMLFCVGNAKTISIVYHQVHRSNGDPVVLE